MHPTTNPETITASTTQPEPTTVVSQPPTAMEVVTGDATRFSHLSSLSVPDGVCHFSRFCAVRGRLSI